MVVCIEHDKITNFITARLAQQHKSPLDSHTPYSSDCLFGWLFGFLTSSSTTRGISRAGPKTERLTILRAATHLTELGDLDFCLSLSHYTDTDPNSRERAATTGIEPGTSSPFSR